MLTTIRIKNLALVTDLTLEFQPGYNVITGETGAGKSILIGALTLVLGERADRTLIRSGSESCSVEAVFDVGRLKAPLGAFLDANGLEPCEADQLVVKRTLTASGANRQFINGSPTTLNILAGVGEWLVDIHGPHEHQSLLNPSQQLAMLDAFGALEAEREGFAQLLRKRAAVEAEKAALIVDEKTYAHQLDLLRFQANEISAAHFLPGEEEQLDQEHRRASNAARLLQLSQTGLELLGDNEGSLFTQAGVLGRTLQELNRIDSTASPLPALHEHAVAAFRELQTELSRYAERLELDPARLRELEDRLNLLHGLKRKYGSSVAEILEFGQETQRKLTALEQRESELARLNEQTRSLGKELRLCGRALSEKRRNLLGQLSKKVVKQLADLGFKQSRFDISLSSLESADTEMITAPQPDPHKPQHPPRVSFQGFDAIEFLFSPNPGEPPRPLRAIASSGELARVMLALKTVLAAEDQIPVLVFDEVDANIGGETARTVGEKMQQIAHNRQVLCITHLAHVAAPASVHFVASKQVKAGRTISEISRLEAADRVTELARMLGGQSDAARKHAEALLNSCAG
ncbi:MAG TPA: DNA repair protein RecN [Verrucomicrobiae bacterium]